MASRFPDQNWCKNLRVTYARTQLYGLTDEERLSLIREFCQSCGSKDPKCQCWNDE